jgi:hypothetical protein
MENNFSGTLTAGSLAYDFEDNWQKPTDMTLIDPDGYATYPTHIEYDQYRQLYPDPSAGAQGVPRPEATLVNLAPKSATSCAVTVGRQTTRASTPAGTLQKRMLVVHRSFELAVLHGRSLAQFGVEVSDATCPGCLTGLFKLERGALRLVS